MAAGLGFKDFTTGEVLTAADVDGYLMQGVWVFASAAARDAAVTSPQEGNFAYLKDTNVTTYYTGSAWANLDTTGMTNPMTTTGDTIYSSSGSTPARLGIGTAGQVLKVNSGATAPEWAAASSGALTLIDEVPFTASSTINVNDVFSSTYTNYRILISGASSTGSDCNLTIRFRLSGSDTNTNYKTIRIYGENSAAGSDFNGPGTDEIGLCQFGSSTLNGGLATYDITNPNVATQTGITGLGSGASTSNASMQLAIIHGQQTDSTQFTGFTILSTQTATGRISVYGYQKE
jgi:hypothetical protein